MLTNDNIPKLAFAFKWSNVLSSTFSILKLFMTYILLSSIAYHEYLIVHNVTLDSHNIFKPKPRVYEIFTSLLYI